MLGALRPGPGWRPRSDDKYSCPASIEALRSANLAYVSEKLRHGRPGPYSKELLQEVVEETRLGRMIGPLRAPGYWPARTVALHDLAGMDCLLDPPPGDLFRGRVICHHPSG